MKNDDPFGNDDFVSLSGQKREGDSMCSRLGQLKKKLSSCNNIPNMRW